MGLLKKIGKRIKRVFKGVKKVFKKVTKFVGRAMKSKWGKALMIAATVFTMGAAAGAWGGFGAAGAAGGATSTAGGFFSKFVGAAKNIFGVGGGAGAAGAAGTASGAALAAPGTFGQAASMIAPAAAQGAGAAASGVGGLMAKAGQAAMGFLKSPGGATLAGNVIKGYAEGKAQEAQMEEDERQARYYDNQWRDPNQLNQLHTAASSNIVTPEGFMNRARRVDKYLDERANRFPTGTPDPDQVAGYAVAGA